MEWYFYNTDAHAFSGPAPLDALISKRIAVTGGEKKFGEELRQLKKHDTLLMYHNGTGVVAVGEVLKPWDGRKHHDLQYYDDHMGHEYRVRVNWFHVLSEDPLTAKEIGYVPRGAVQKIDKARASLESLLEKRINKPIRLRTDEADRDGTTDKPYLLRYGDQRERVRREIRQRRGQQKFRNSLRERYDDRCIVTGCRITALLEAAHIQEYRRDDHNDPQNGLLLRADIHTLFDLDLLGIEPDALRVQLHPDVAKEYAMIVGKSLSCPGERRPSRDALKLRYKRFQRRLRKPV